MADGAKIFGPSLLHEFEIFVFRERGVEGEMPGLAVDDHIAGRPGAFFPVPGDFAELFDRTPHVVRISRLAVKFDGVEGSGAAVSLLTNVVIVKCRRGPFDERGALRRFLAKFLGIETAVTQEFRGETFLFISQAQQQMLGADVAMGQPVCLISCILENALGFVAEWQVDGGRCGVATRVPLVDSGAYRFDATRRLQKSK